MHHATITRRAVMAGTAATAATAAAPTIAARAAGNPDAELIAMAAEYPAALEAANAAIIALCDAEDAHMLGSPKWPEAKSASADVVGCSFEDRHPTAEKLRHKLAVHKRRLATTYYEPCVEQKYRLTQKHIDLIAADLEAAEAVEAERARLHADLDIDRLFQEFERLSGIDRNLLEEIVTKPCQTPAGLNAKARTLLLELADQGECDGAPMGELKPGHVRAFIRDVIAVTESA